MTIGVYIGRFQPFHYGHLHALMYAWDRSDSLYIGIGTKKQVDCNNPYSFSDRFNMINNTVQKIGLRNITIFEIKDQQTDKEWIEIIEKHLPQGRYNVFSNNPTVKKAYEGNMNGLVIDVPMTRNDIYSGTEIRLKILHGDNWQKYVPIETVRVIQG